MPGNIRSIIIGCTLGAALALFFAPKISFATSLPATRDATVVSGATTDVEIPIANSGSSDAEYTVLLFSALFQPGVDQPQLQELSSDIASWISVSSSSLTVTSGTSVPVTLSIHPSADALPQTFTVAVVASEKIEGEIVLIHGTATLVFVSIGDAMPRGACQSFLQDAPGVARLTLSNDGRGILYDSGEIILRGMFGVRLGTTSSNPSFHRVSSGQTRTWQVFLPAIPWWAIGPLSYSVSDTQLDEQPCAGINAGARWLPLFGIGIVALGAAILFIRRRIS